MKLCKQLLWVVCLITVGVLVSVTIISFMEVGIDRRAIRMHIKEDKANELFRLYSAIAAVESENNPNAFNPKENAAGLLQIRPICVVDCNRIVGFERWSLSDRYSPAASFEMFKLYVTYYQEHYDLSGPESAARIWNGGPRG